MMRWLFFPLVLAALPLVGCSADNNGDEKKEDCEPRKTIFCRCPSDSVHPGESGWKTCRKDGSGYDECGPCDGSNYEGPDTTGGGNTNVPSEGQCGNGKVENGEDCDDGNFNDDDACLSNCRQAKCGDSFIRTGVEECDDGNDVDTDGCSSTCKAQKPASEACPGQDLVVTADPGGVAVENDFGTLTNDLTGSCGGDGPEAVYHFVAPSTGTVTASITMLDGAQADTVIYARKDDCAAGVDTTLSNGCANEGGTGANELIKFDVEKNGSYYVFADSQGTPTGTFSLRVRFRPDEACEGVGGPCVAADALGACQDGTLACSQNSLVCQAGKAAAEDTCGDGIDNNCDGNVDENCGCGHDVCAEGPALNQACGDVCVAKLCEEDPFCCSDGWDAKCVSEVLGACGTARCVQNTCAHPICAAGAALKTGCDGTPKCVEKICQTDPVCCSSNWDDLCVGKIEDVCKLKCD